LLRLLLLLQELQVVIDGEYRYDGHFDLPHCTALAKLSSNCWSLNIHGNEALPSSLRSLQVGTVEDVDVLLLMTPSLQHLSMRQCSTETAELHKLTALTTLQELHLEYGMEPGYHTDENAYSWESADDDSFVNVSAAAAWGELPMLNSLQLRSQERSGNDGPIKAAAVRHLGAAVGITSLVVDSCWFEFESGAADLAAALSQLTKLQRLRLAGLKQVQSAAAGAAAVAAAAAAAAGSQMANGAAACCSSGSSNCGSGSSDYNSDSDSDSVSNALLAASRDDWQADSLPPASLASVLAAVAQLPQLTHLELEKLPLHKRQTVRRLAAAAALTHLSIERCDLRDDGARALAPCIARLRALRLDNNPNLGTAAVEAIMQMQPPLLCDLSLCGTGLNTEALLRAVMGQGLRREAQQSLISNLGLSEGQVQELLEGVGKLQRLQQEALSLLRNRNGVELDVDAALLLQAIIETSDL
jgi:hypothetical protein